MQFLFIFQRSERPIMLREPTYNGGGRLMASEGCIQPIGLIFDIPALKAENSQSGPQTVSFLL